MLILLRTTCKCISTSKIKQLIEFPYIFSWFRMTSGVISEAVLVNLNDPRYFQHGGNLMVKTLLLMKQSTLLFERLD